MALLRLKDQIQNPATVNGLWEEACETRNLIPTEKVPEHNYVICPVTFEDDILIQWSCGAKIELNKPVL